MSRDLPPSWLAYHRRARRIGKFHMEEHRLRYGTDKYIWWLDPRGKDPRPVLVGTAMTPA